ncbi:MAG TPA: outer membrane beta-barrel protein, partial [Bacteroidia bacterium]|nr:outer membrane beta-barrel protein [Bacteroidia bacterium]
MNKIKFVVCLIIMCVARLSAQNKDTSGFQLAFGIRANTFLASDISQTNQPPVRLLVNGDFLKYLRLEVQYGFAKNIVQKQYNTPASGIRSIDLNDRTNSYSFGLFGKTNRKSVSIYCGFRYGMIKYEKDDVDYTSSGDYYAVPGDGNITMLSGVLGGEYFFVKHFSVG